MYGKSVLPEMINEMFHRELYEYIDAQKLDIIGQPLVAEGQAPIDFDLKFLGDFEIKFEIGLAPAVELQGWDDVGPYTYYQVEIPDAKVEEELEKGRRSLGTDIHPEEDIQESDVVKLEVKELEEDGEDFKSEGVESEFSILIERISDQAVKEQMLELRKGEKLKVNIFELEQFADSQADDEKAKEEFVKTHLLQLPREDESKINPWFEATIIDVQRRIPAELNQEFFDQFFGPGAVENEEEAKERIREAMKVPFEKEADALLYRAIMQHLMEQITLPLPDDFLKKWLTNSYETISSAVIEKEYDKFARQMRWSLIRSKLIELHEIEASEEEVIERTKVDFQRYAQYLQNADDNVLTQIARRHLSEDPKRYQSYHEDVLLAKLQTRLKEEVDFEEQVVSEAFFKDLIKQAQKENQEESPNFFEEEEE